MSTVPATAQDERFEWPQHQESQPAPEPQAASAPRLARRALWTIALLAIGALALCELHYWMLRGEIARKQGSKVNSQLLATQLRDAKMLTRYQWVKPSAGVLRIPEARAVSLVIADYSKQAQPLSVGTAVQAASASVDNERVP
jgi:hypothetical protein